MIALDDDVALLAPGAVWLRAHQTVVVADLHAGYVATLQHRGFALPSVEDSDLHARLRAVLRKTSARALVVAGDFVHGRGAVLRRDHGPSALDAVLDALNGVELVVVEGNHDRGVGERLYAAGVRCTEDYAVGPHRVAHGDVDTEALRREAVAGGGRLILGHHHPALTLRDGAGTHKKVPAFAHCEGLVCLPAMSPFARGADLRNREHSAAIEHAAGGAVLSVSVVIGERVIAVGPLDRVRAAG